MNETERLEQLVRDLLAALKECRTRLVYLGFTTYAIDEAIQDAEKMMGGGE